MWNIHENSIKLLGSIVEINWQAHIPCGRMIIVSRY